jgi:hypothetical protein
MLALAIGYHIAFMLGLRRTLIDSARREALRGKVSLLRKRP